MQNKIMEVLTPRRMMTVGNLALSMEIDAEELHPKLVELATDGRVRYAQSRCSGSCSTCSTCTTSSSGKTVEDNLALDSTAIVISLEIHKTEDD